MFFNKIKSMYFAWDFVTKAYRVLFTKWGERGSVKSWQSMPDPNCECDTMGTAMKGTETLIYSQIKRARRHLNGGLFCVQKSSGERAKSPHAVLFTLPCPSTPH